MLHSVILCATLLASASLFNAVAGSTALQRLNKHMSRRAAHAGGTSFHRPQLDARTKSKYRYLTSATSKYKVDSLPDVNFDIGEMYSGLVPIDMKNASRALFFVFQPKLGTPVDEITIWFNGGPGCSSLEGFFQENGRFQWQPGTFAPVEAKYSWVNQTNMLWVEQPVGTGFSIGEVRAKSEADIAADFLNFFKNFQTIFGISKYKIYVTGESYAGRYVPYVSGAMLDKKDKTHFDLKGALVYDPCIGEFGYGSQVPTLPFLQANQVNFKLNDTFMAKLEGIDKQCGYAQYREEYLRFPALKHQPPTYFDYDKNASCDISDISSEGLYNLNPCFNPYDTQQQCPIVWDVLGFPTILMYTPPGSEVYFNRTDVKKAMHAPMIEWAECAGPVFIGEGGPQGEGDLSPDPIQHVLPQVIEGTNRVLVSNGDFDMVIQTNGTLLAIQNMTWNGKLGFQSAPKTPIVIHEVDLDYAEAWCENGGCGLDGEQGTMGVQHYERGLMWAQTFMSGHMQPQYQPRSAYKHLQWVRGEIDTL